MKPDRSSNVFLLAARQTTKQAATTKKPAATTRAVQVKNCDNDDDFEEDEKTLTGKIVVQDCPCEKRFANNATRLAAVSTAVCTQLRTHFQQLYGTKINYPCSLKVLSGDKTHTVFAYTVEVPQPQRSQAKAALKKTCKDDEVSYRLEEDSHDEKECMPLLCHPQ